MCPSACPGLARRYKLPTPEEANHVPSVQEPALTRQRTISRKFWLSYACFEIGVSQFSEIVRKEQVLDSRSDDKAVEMGKAERRDPNGDDC